MLKWVYESAKSCDIFDDIVFAVDAKETFDLLKSFSAPVIYTDSRHTCGTDRLIEARKATKIKADVWVNWQADEPFLQRTQILDLLQGVNGSGDVWTLKTKIEDPSEIENPNVVKVVCGEKGRALYFSRHPIPYAKNSETKVCYYKHFGIYAYKDASLDCIEKMSPSNLELAESLEQLRYLYHNLNVFVYETKTNTIGIDTKEDLILAEEFAKQHQAILTLNGL